MHAMQYLTGVYIVVYILPVIEKSLWQPNPPRLFTDAAAARLMGSTRGHMRELRHRGWLSPRAPVPRGETGSKGRLRYSFRDLVAAEVARISRDEFGWPPKDLRRVAEIIRSGDEDVVRAATIAVFKGDVPGTVRAAFFAPGELAKGSTSGKRLARAEKNDEILQKVSLLEVVETVANGLYEKMKQAGFEFAGVVDGPKPKRQKRKRN